MHVRDGRESKQSGGRTQDLQEYINTSVCTYTKTFSSLICFILLLEPKTEQ